MNTGVNNPNWKGGRSVASNGYIIVRVGVDHHLADVRGYAYEHRIVAEQKLGRRLCKGEQPHHINGNKQDNRPENLVVMKSMAHHRNQHRKRNTERKLADQPNPTIICQCGCGALFGKFDNDGRPRVFVSGHNPQGAPTREQILKFVAHSPLHTRQLAAVCGRSHQAIRLPLGRKIGCTY